MGEVTQSIYLLRKSIHTSVVHTPTRTFSSRGWAQRYLVDSLVVLVVFLTSYRQVRFLITLLILLIT